MKSKNAPSGAFFEPDLHCVSPLPCHNGGMSFLRRFAFVPGILLLLLLLQVSCKPEKALPLPTGPQTLSGSLHSVELSLVRRGTHVLRQQEKDVYFVESSTINLREFEGADVVIKGALEQNVSQSFLPVLIATEVGFQELPLKEWSVPLLHLRLQAPSAWDGSVYDDGILFTQTGGTRTMLKIYRSSLETLPSGTPMVVGGERAVRVERGSGSLVVYVHHAPDLLMITYNPPAGEQAATSLQYFVRLLRSITFTQTPYRGSGSTLTGSGTSTGGIPCGGLAGILCPTGQYCEVNDATTGIGKCRDLKKS